MKKSFSTSMVQAVDSSKASAAHWPEAEAFCRDISFDKGAPNIVEEDGLSPYKV